MIAFVATLSLAADYCPPRAEGFAFAALMSVTNFTAALSENLGSFLYEHLFQRQLDPLILVSAAFTAVAFAFVPLLRLARQATRATRSLRAMFDMLSFLIAQTAA